MESASRKRPLRIVQVSQDVVPHVGGTTHVVYYLCRELSKNPAFSVTWCAGGRPHDIGLPGVRLLAFRQYNPLKRLAGIDYPFWSLWALFRLFFAVRSSDVVHVHTHNIIGGCAALIFACMLKKPRIVTLHSPLWQEGPYRSRLVGFMHWINRKISEYTIPHFTAVTTMNGVAILFVFQ